MMVNRKSIFALALLLSALPFSGKAQNSADMRLYFGETLKKGSTAGIDVPEKKISVSKIGSVRQAVWEAWQQANEAFEEEKLSKCVKRLMDMAVDYNNDAYRAGYRQQWQMVAAR